MKRKPGLITILDEGAALVLRNRVTLLRALLIPAIFIIGIDYLSSLELTSTVNIILYLLTLIINTAFAIIVHRIVLLGPEGVFKWGLYRWTMRESYYFIHLFLIITFCALLYLSSFVLGFIGLVIGTVGSVYLFVRFSLIFPASAVDKGLTFKTSWVLSKNHQLLMLYIILIMPLIFYIPTYSIMQITSSFWILSLISMVATVFTVSFLSIAYREICKYEYGASYITR